MVVIMNNKLFECVLDGITMERIVRNEELVMPGMHFHPEYEIYYMFNGERYYFIENKTYHIRKGNLVLIDSMQIHKTSVLGQDFHDRFLIELNAEPFSTFFQNISGMSIAEFFVENACVMELDEQTLNQVESCFNEIIEEGKGKLENYSTFIMLKITEILLLAQRFHHNKIPPANISMSNKSKHHLINEVLAYINQGSMHAKTLDDISKHFYISKSYLCRTFKDVTGFTVQEYINISCVKIAQQLLEQNDLRISQIAHRLGFSSITYFERVFQKYTETTPLKYRKKQRIVKEKVRNKHK